MNSVFEILILVFLVINTYEIYRDKVSTISWSVQMLVLTFIGWSLNNVDHNQLFSTDNIIKYALISTNTVWLSLTVFYKGIKNVR